MKDEVSCDLTEDFLDKDTYKNRNERIEIEREEEVIYDVIVRV